MLMHSVWNRQLLQKYSCDEKHGPLKLVHTKDDNYKDNNKNIVVHFFLSIKE